MEKRYKLAEAKAKFSEVIRAAKAGEKVVLVERNEPILVFMPYQSSLQPEAVLAQLASSGKLREAEAPISTIKRATKSKPGALKRFLKDRSRW
jgi:prevent-host-death family protein